MKIFVDAKLIEEKSLNDKLTKELRQSNLLPKRPPSKSSIKDSLEIR